jgi:para-aminobenzoate synthetase/4-amino-4-deoxychorismate lyase
MPMWMSMEPIFRVVAGTAPALCFERPRAVLRGDPGRMREALLCAQAALDDGFWIAGYLAYDATAALGVFEPPRESTLPHEAIEHSPLLPLVGRTAFASHVRALQRAIYEGSVYEVNYTLPFAFHLRCHPFALYAHYAHRSQARYQCYVEDGDRAILSWSPELFLEFDGRRVRTKPMKGTARLDRTGDLHGEKNISEHVMIVDLLRNDLHRVCETVAVEKLLTIERYPTFATMTSTMCGHLREGVTLADVFAAAFPCGSVTGAPKRSAMKFITEHEPQPRGVYCGTIGFLSPQQRGWWNVAIRTAQVGIGTRAGRYDAGGAIVADSDAGEEWNEIMLKARLLSDGAPLAILETFAADASETTIEAHLERLDRTAQAFGILYDARAVRSAARRWRDANTLVRLRVSSGGTFRIAAEPRHLPPQPVRVCVAKARVRHDDPFLAHKTSWRPAHDAAARQANEWDCFDALLLNERGELAEGARSTLFAEIGGRLSTPPLSSGVLPGILRRHLVSEGRACERVVTLAELRRASAIYVGNSARGLLRAELVE